MDKNDVLMALLVAALLWGWRLFALPLLWIMGVAA